MTAEQFKAWRAHMGFSQAAAGKALGVSRVTIEAYERGVRRDNGRLVEIPKSIELACAAIALGISSYSGPQGTTAQTIPVEDLSAENDE